MILSIYTCDPASWDGGDGTISARTLDQSNICLIILVFTHVSDHFNLIILVFTHVSDHFS
jgi:hypothetical protein